MDDWVGEAVSDVGVCEFAEEAVGLAAVALAG
jgi:hypothetical protein